jgi:alkaline phosphatase
MKRNAISFILIVLLVLGTFSGYSANATGDETTTGDTNQTTTTATTTTQQEAETTQAELENKLPKYVFMLIGDGMSAVQVNAAQVYNGNNSEGEVDTADLLFTEFPAVGLATTHDSTSFCPDSASTATAMSTGYKTHSGVIGLAVDKTTEVTNIAELLQEQGKKIGIISNVTINHATPAAYYAHAESRNDYYGIALQMAE